MQGDDGADGVGTDVSGVYRLPENRRLRKNDRERQRRAEVNDRFEELYALVQETGATRRNRSDKTSVLDAAVQHIHALRSRLETASGMRWKEALDAPLPRGGGGRRCAPKSHAAGRGGGRGGSRRAAGGASPQQADSGLA